MNFRKLSIHNLDFEKYADFQKLVFNPLLAKSGFNSALLNKEEYLWKYKGAWKEGVIYVVEKDNSYIGSSAIVPYLMEDHFQNQFWCVQVFDNAMDKRYRKKNIFYELYDKTNQNELGYTCFGYPNENAISTILKSNGHIKEELFFWIRFKSGLIFRKSDTGIYINLIQHSSDIPKLNPYIESMSVRKDEKYIKWRYFDRPGRNYSVYKVADKTNDGFSLVILSEVNYRGLTIHLILDAIGTNPYHHKNAIRLLMSKIDTRGIYLVLTNDTSQVKAASFLKIPPLFAPKKHYLVYTERENTPIQIKSLTWHAAMGDWEVF